MPKVIAKAKIQAWLEDPTTPYNAWESLTYDRIAAEAGVGRSSVDQYLATLVARTRGYTLAKVKRRRKTAWRERVKTMPKVIAKAEIQAWLEDPTTPYNAWEHLTYDEIAEQTGVGRSSVDRHLVILVAMTRGYAVAEVKRRRKNAWYERVNRMTDENLILLKAYRAQDPPLSYEECAVKLDQSLWSVKYHCEKHNL